MTSTRYRILISHVGDAFAAEVVELPFCRGYGDSYAEALAAAEYLLNRLLQQDLGHIGGNRFASIAQACLARKPSDRRVFSPVKIRLVEKFGLLSNRELAAHIGIVGRDAPSKLARAIGGSGAREVRCAIAGALSDLPSRLWPDRSLKVSLDDDEAVSRLLISRERSRAILEA